MCRAFLNEYETEAGVFVHFLMMKKQRAGDFLCISIINERQAGVFRMPVSCERGTHVTECMYRGTVPSLIRIENTQKKKSVAPY